MGVAVQPACSTASSVTNGWTLKTKLRYAARIIHRFLIIFHITFVAFCLLPPRIYILMPSPCCATPCHAVLCRVVCLVWALIEHKCRQFTWNICTVLITRGNFKIDSVLFAQHSNEQVLCQRPKSTADVTWSASVCSLCVCECVWCSEIKIYKPLSAVLRAPSQAFCGHNMYVGSANP